MAGEFEPYPTPAGVEAAIKEAAKRAASAEPSLGTDHRIRIEYFNRFLSRVFREGHSSEWLLKGGTGMLARVPSARATLDIDLYITGYTLEQAMADLLRLAEQDLRDHFRFVYKSYGPMLGGNIQPYSEGRRVEFDVYIGAQRKSPLRVDLAIGAGLTAEPAMATPANALDLPRLTSSPYRLYPVVDQIADKVCATIYRYGERASSREKDLVDLVVLAVTHDIDGNELERAIATETRRRRMDPILRFVVPAEWGPAYSRLARTIPHCIGFEDVDSAERLVSSMIDPALNNDASGRSWRSRDRAWN